MRYSDSLYLALSNKRLLNGSGVKLTPRDLLKLWEFYNLFVGSAFSRLIMRGESDKNLYRQFNTDTKNPVALAGCLFMTGEKARYCWNNNKFVDPDDTSPNNFKRICESLYYAILDGERGVSKRADRIRLYCLNNAEFCKALENISEILITYQSLSICERQIANLHYLSILHTINSLEYKRGSGFVSTTTSAQVAGEFAEDCIIYGWVPKPPKVSIVGRTRTIDLLDTRNSKSLKQLGLPYPSTPVYREQNEVSIRCGLLPHFIIGFTAGKNFYVNPAIFQAMDKMHDLSTFRALSNYKRDLQLGGLEVNQENFEEFLRQTNYRRYFTYDGEEYKIHQAQTR